MPERDQWPLDSDEPGSETRVDHSKKDTRSLADPGYLCQGAKWQPL